MENIKFLREIFGEKTRLMREFGDYMVLVNEKNYVRFSCQSASVFVEIIDKEHGLVDAINFPFSSFFKEKQTAPENLKFNQYIEDGNWLFPEYPHCQPTKEDFKNLSDCVLDYAFISN